VLAATFDCSAEMRCGRNPGTRYNAAVMLQIIQATVRIMLEFRNGDSLFILDLLPSNSGDRRLAALNH
jgi:hypothetical protein